MSKHSGENTLLQMIRNIKDTYDYLKGLIDEKQKPYVIKATCNLTSATGGLLADISCTFDEITAAYNRGDHIFLDLDIGQIVPDQRCVIGLVSYLYGNYAVFEQIVNMGGGSSHITAIIDPSGYGYVIIAQLTTYTQLDQAVSGVKQVLLTGPVTTADGGFSGTISITSHTHEEIVTAVRNDIPVILCLTAPLLTVPVRLSLSFISDDGSCMFNGVFALSPTDVYVAGCMVSATKTSHDYMFIKQPTA